jgi:hypothetical protein
MKEREMSLTYVVGTGRCGSTMLSRILQGHPEVLSLSEFWNIFLRADEPVATRDIPTEDMTGDEYWQLLTRISPHHDGLAGTGIESYFGRRFDAATGVPMICRTLGPIADDPDALYDALDGEVPGWPRQPFADHCRALFGFIAGQLGRSVIVERSGGGIGALPTLREQYPEARFVFLHRDGADSALSMSRYPVFRLLAIKFIASYEDKRKNPKIPLLADGSKPRPEDFEGLLEPPFDVERFMSYPVSLQLFGAMWSMLTGDGVSEMLKLPPDRWTILRYEQMLGDARTELTRFAEFIGVSPDPRWLTAAEAYVDRGRRGSALAQLDPAALAALQAACTPGTEAFGRLESEHAAAVGVLT